MTSKAIQFVQLLRSSKREKRLGTVILFVTSRCNAFCQTCFYHAELNQPGDMTFAQIEKLSQTMPAITDLWLSGGEPTLRRDLSDIIDLFIANNGVNRVIIPTNGLIKSRVYDVVDVRLEVDLRAVEVHALAEAGERGAVDGMAILLEEGAAAFPLPAAGGGAVDHDKGVFGRRLGGAEAGRGEQREQQGENGAEQFIHGERRARPDCRSLLAGDCE